MSPRTASASLTEPSFIELFTPKLVTVFREGYGWPDLRADAISGLTVAVVALPLSMAIAIASGASPERGLYTAIVGGLIISLIGGSRFQIGGPAGAFIGLVAGVVERHGYDGLALATIVAGLILIAIGLLRAGTYIKYIPFPVTVGFTAGIAVIIAASQIRDLLGLFSLEKLQAVLPDAVAIALLGAIESLLSAVVADGMTGRRHRSNCELSAQGVANITSVLFGGICVTGTVARTATNVRAGARGPVSGIFHCVYLLIFLLIGAPLVGYIPWRLSAQCSPWLPGIWRKRRSFGRFCAALVAMQSYCCRPFYLRFSSTSSPPSPLALYWARCCSCIEWRKR